MKKSAQKEKILDLLNNSDWVCTSDFYAMFIADPRARLFELQKAYPLEKRKCQQHNYHAGGSKEWRIAKTARIFVPSKPQRWVTIDGERIAV